jgi:hypothetical protein
MRYALLAMAVVAAVIAVPPVFAEDESDLEPIPLELPKPHFGGTPLDYMGENLEMMSFKPRPPLLAPKGTTNVAAGKTVTASVEKATIGTLAMAVDGDKNFADESVLELPEGHQWIQIDLGGDHEIYAVVVWHYYAAQRVYFDVSIKTAQDDEFKKDVKVLFNNDHDNSSETGTGKDKEYVEDNKGKLIDAGGVQGRYVRLYSKGNTSDNMSHYVEVEVFAKPAS